MNVTTPNVTAAAASNAVRVREDLRSFQLALARRIAQAQVQNVQEQSRLVVQLGGVNVMLRLSDIAEVIDYSEPTPTPLTQPWFLGLLNVRGNLKSVIDLPAWLSGSPSQKKPQTRLITLAAQVEPDVAIWVDKVVGLASLDKNTYRKVDKPGTYQAVYFGQGYYDEAGEMFIELDLGLLVKQAEFLDPNA